MRVRAMGADELNELRKDAEIALATGNASKAADYYVHPVVGPEYREKVDKQVDRVGSEEYKFSSKQIEKSIKGEHKSLVDPLGQMKYMTSGANAHYQRMYDAEYARIKGENDAKPEGEKLSEQAIATQAENFTLSQRAKDKDDPKHLYYVDPKNGNMPNYPQPPAEASESAVRANVNTLTTEAKTQSGVLNAVVAKPSLVLSSEEVVKLLKFSNELVKSTHN